MKLLEQQILEPDMFHCNLQSQHVFRLCYLQHPFFLFLIKAILGESFDCFLAHSSVQVHELLDGFKDTTGCLEGVLDILLAAAFGIVLKDE